MDFKGIKLDFNSWFNKWIEHRKKEPAHLIVEPFNQLKLISVTAYPHNIEVPKGKDYLSYLYEYKGEKKPIPFFRESLSVETAQKLTDTLDLIKSLHGIDFDHALAYMTMIFLTIADFKRACAGLDPILDSMNTGKIEYFFNEQLKKKRYIEIERFNSLWKMDNVLEFWQEYGTPFYEPNYNEPSNPAAIFRYYYQIPPVWLTIDDFKNLFGESKTPPPIPVYTTIERFTALSNFEKTLESVANTPGILEINVNFNLKQEKPSYNTDKEFIHSADYRSIRLRDKHYEPTPKQAEVIQLLHETYLAGNFSLGQHYILNKLQIDSGRLRDVFKSNMDIWNEVITKGERRDTFRLNLNI